MHQFVFKPLQHCGAQALLAHLGIDDDNIDPCQIGRDSCLNDSDYAIVLDCNNSRRTIRYVIDKLGNVDWFCIGQASALLEQPNGGPDVGEQ
jgi:hypothetical protein